MWLFVGGLGAVVVGSFALLGTAIRQGDVVVLDVPRPALNARAAALPALAARNHAATPAP
jgi:hypothetical protein